MKKRPTLWVLLFLGVIACGKVELHHGLTEMEVDEILYILHQGGIDAIKKREVSGQEVSWVVAVTAEKEASARQVLMANNLPKRREMGLSEVYKEKGLIPTPDEQKARFLLALKGEIINSLEKIPGVVDADIVLNVPEENEFADLKSDTKRPTASVVVRTKQVEGGTAPVSEAKIQRFVANSVPNLNPNDISVIISSLAVPATATHGPSTLFPTPTTAPRRPLPSSSPVVELAGIKVQQGSIGRLKVYFVSLLGLLVAVSAALLVNVVRLNRLRLRLQTGTPVESVPLEAGQRQALLGAGPGEGMEGTFDVGKREAR